MAEYTDHKLESFLLGTLPSPDREEIEQRIFADDELFVRVEDLETDLIDRFVRDELSPGLRARFEESLESSPARQEKIRFARLLDRKLGARRNDVSGTLLLFTKKLGVTANITLAAALFILVIGTPALLHKLAAPVEEAAPQAKRRGAQPADSTAPPAEPAPNARAIAATDSASSIETPSMSIKQPRVPSIATKKPPVPSVTATTAVTFVLSTVSLRSGTELSTLEIRDSVSQVVVQLGIESDDYPSYNVDIRNASGTSIWSAKRLPLSAIDGVPAVSFEVPASAFVDGRHELVLAGVGQSGTEEIAYVDFDVRHRR